MHCATHAAVYITHPVHNPGGGDSHIKWTGMLVGNFEFNP